MRNVIRRLLAATAAAALAGCAGESNPDQNVVITNDIPPHAEIEAVPPDETVPPDEPAANENTNAL